MTLIYAGIHGNECGKARANECGKACAGADFDPDLNVLAGASVAFGVFDGLHAGHRYLIGQAAQTAAGGEGGAAGAANPSEAPAVHSRLASNYENRDCSRNISRFSCSAESLECTAGASAGSLECTAGASSSQDANRCVVLTFDIDPDEVFHPQRLKKLMRNADRLQALAALPGVDDVVVLPFTPELYTLEPEAFLQRAFAGHTPAHLHVGEDFRFGAKAAGTVQTLRNWEPGRKADMQVHAHALVSADGTPITATRIRLLLLDGKVREAAALLGRPYFICGTVEKGRGDGADFGFATANMQVKPHDRVLGEGVYAGYATVEGDDRRYKAAISVGVSPTFEAESTANMEVHLLDFQGDLVGRELCVEFVEFLRPMMKFESTEELIAEVTRNIQWVRENL